MKITTKINLLTAMWVLFIMVFIDTAVFFSFIKTTVNMEENMQYQKAEEIIKELDTIQSSNNVEAVLKNYLTMYSYIRIVQPNNTVAYEVTNDPLLSKKVKGTYTEKKYAKNDLIFAEDGEERILVVRVPLQKNGPINGSLEIGERLIGLENRTEILRAILISCTALALFLSLLGGKWLANMIMRPISNMIKTMEEIESSGVLKTIPPQNQTKDELQIMVRTFNRMIERIQINMDKQRQFISDASHELKTPLTIIKNYANFLRRHGLENKEMSEEAISAIHSEATRIQKMTDTLLELATLEKEYALEIKSFNLIHLCQTILKQLKDVYKRDISLHYEDDELIIQADELKVKQVIIILLDNAMKYSQDNIQITLKKKEPFVSICIKDYGIGIPTDELNHIFERFYRVDIARSRETGGTGLGLSIAKNIMTLHKGEIKVTSMQNEGTEVELLLPITSQN